MSLLQLQFSPVDDVLKLINYFTEKNTKVETIRRMLLLECQENLDLIYRFKTPGNTHITLERKFVLNNLKGTIIQSILFSQQSDSIENMLELKYKTSIPTFLFNKSKKSNEQKKFHVVDFLSTIHLSISLLKTYSQIPLTEEFQNFEFEKSVDFKQRIQNLKFNLQQLNKILLKSKKSEISR